MHEFELIRALRELQRNMRLSEAFALLEERPEVEFSDFVELRILFGILKALKGEVFRAREILANIEPSELKDEESLSDYGFLLFLTHQPEEALKYLERALELNPNCFIAHARISAIYILIDKFEEAEKHLTKALELSPERVELLYNLSVIKFRQGRYEEALEILDRCIRLAPERREFYVKRTEYLKALERVDEYIEELFEKIRANPEDKFFYLNLTLVFLSIGKEEEALSIVESALERFPEDEEVKRVFIEVCLKTESYYLLGTKLKEWVEKEPESEDLRFLLNEARIKVGFLEAAEKDLDEMPQALKADPRWKFLKAKILHEKNQTSQAVEILSEAIELFPGHVGIRSELAHYLLSLGRKEEARAHLEALSQISPSARIQLLRYKDYQVDQEELWQLEKAVREGNIPLEQRISLAFTLAEVYERIGEYDKSFEVVSLGNELTRSIVRYDWREHRRFVQRIAEAFNKELIERLSGKGHPSERPIFIVGMPRSGTTLVEQILASHSQVYGAGELSWIGRITQLFPRVNGGYPYPEGIKYMDERHLKSAGEYYLEKLKIYNETAPRVTDKLPHNFDHVGLIHLIFPKAKIIHIHRDPRDVAVSNFYQNFAAMRGLMGFANDLKDIGHMLNDYLFIMDHWYKTLPEGRIFKVVYEELVSEPEKVIRELLEYCELPWEDKVLEFYYTERPVKTASIQQVRSEIYQESKGKWRRYEKYLKPLLEVLEQGFVPLEY